MNLGRFIRFFMYSPCITSIIRRMTQSSNLKKYQAAWFINSKCRMWIWSSHVSHDKHSIQHACIILNNPITWLSSYMNIHNAITIYVMCSVWWWRYSYSSWSLVSTGITSLQVTMSDISFSVFTKREYPIFQHSLHMNRPNREFFIKVMYIFTSLFLLRIIVIRSLFKPWQSFRCSCSLTTDWLFMTENWSLCSPKSTSRFASPSFAASPFIN